MEEDEKSHFCLIKNLNKLVSSQLSKSKTKKWICDGCLVYFRNEQDLRIHNAIGCNKMRVNLPTEWAKWLKFKNYQHNLKVPYVIYCDFEALLKPIDLCLPNAEKSFTKNIVKHEPCSFAYYVKCSYDDSKIKFELYRGENCGKIFIEKLTIDLHTIYKDLRYERDTHPLSQVQQNAVDNSTTYHICKGTYDEAQIIR